MVILSDDDAPVIGIIMVIKMVVFGEIMVVTLVVILGEFMLWWW
jgi:hypothetical protein